jgi:ribosome biogenesis GTPase
MAKKKTRVDLRKNRGKPPRDNQWTQGFQSHGFEEEATTYGERVNRKGELSRRRTVMQDDGAADRAMPAAGGVGCLRGRVTQVNGLQSVVETDDGRTYRCAVRRLLKSLVTGARSVVTTGDVVEFRPSGGEGLIERVEPRHGVLTRASRRREHVLVANVDQVVIAVSLSEPDLKPHLIDRYLATARRGGLTPVICLNKADLVETVDCQPLVGAYSQLGITTILTSATTGLGIDRLRAALAGRESVFAGQSGVGKSSLLNAVQPGLGLRVRSISSSTEKGRHTTTTAELIRLDGGGWVVDTPGVRQLQLWDVHPGEVEEFFPELHPFVPHCVFPDCTHTHEDHCAVKRAVARRLVSSRRYTSYLGLFDGAGEEGQ